jgi:hypothetical protein
MFLSTQSVFVRRLSLVVGFVAAGYRFVVLEKSWSIVGPPAQDATHPARTLFTNLGNIFIECGLFFVAGWACVRIIAWVIAGVRIRSRSLASSRVPHTTEQLRGGARDFCSVLDQVPAAFMWESYFVRRFAGSPVGPNALEALRNSTIESSLLSIRLLNDFFAPRRYPTDIRAEDYVGYTSPGQFLSSDEARALNKHLAHLTTERADAFPRGWSIYDMIRRCHDAAITFIRFLASPQGQQYRPDMDLDSRIQTSDRIESDMRRFLNQPKKT